MARPTFPRSLFELQQRFPDEDACRQYLIDSRWPDGFRCPRCKGEKGLVLPARALRRCEACGLDTSLTAGTVMHRTRTPLTHWFWAAYLVATHTPGLSAVQLQRQLGLARYETAWLMLHKLRSAMVRPARDLLTGTVEVDEAYLGGFIAGRPGGRTLGDKIVVAAAVEVRGEGSGRVRLQIVPDASGDSLLPFIKAHVAPGSTVRTDGWTGYKHLGAGGFRHQRRVQGSPERAGVILPRVHRVFGNLQTWIRGTHHGVSGKHLQAYLDEFVFRFNRRRTPMAAFQTLLGLGSQHTSPTYRTLVDKPGPAKVE
jgi:transposase-like protein